MALVNIEPEEIKALDAVLKEVKTDIQTGYFLGRLRIKIQSAVQKEFEKLKKKKAKEIIEGEKKKKSG